jgi:hypothetical protein
MIPNRETTEASSREDLVQMKEPLVKTRHEAAVDTGDRATAKGETVSATDEPIARNRFVFGGFVANFISQLRRAPAQLKGTRKTSAHSLYWLSNSRMPRPFYALDPFAVDPGCAVDRSGRPLPWRWERSLSRDLLGHYGLMFGGTVVVIAAFAHIIPTTLNEPVGRAGLPIQKPAVELPQTPQAQAPNPPQTAPNLPQAQAPNPPQTPSKTPQVASPNLPVQIGPPNPSSAAAPPTLPPSKLGPRQQAPSTQAGKGSAAKVPRP